MKRNSFRGSHLGWSLVALCLLMAWTACSSDDGPGMAAPQLHIEEADNVTRTSADVFGLIDANGNSLSECGFYYSITKSDLGNLNGTNSNKTVLTVKEGSVNARLENLVAETTYFFCLYAKSGKTEVRSEVKSFKTLAISVPELNKVEEVEVGEYSLKVRCSIVSDGGADLESFGFDYRKKKEGGTTTWKSINAPKFDEGTTREFTVNIDGLDPASVYEVRAKAINSKGTGYSEVMELKTNELEAPVLSLFNVDDNNVGADFIKLVAEITNNGAVTEITSSGFCWSVTATEPTYTDNRMEVAPNEKKELVGNLTNLMPNTRYYVRAYAAGQVNEESVIGYSKVVTVTTKGIDEPRLFNLKVTDISMTSATCSCEVEGGNVTVLERGFCWSISEPEPTILTGKLLPVDRDGLFRANLMNLEVMTGYYVRAYLKYSIGGTENVVYSDSRYFETKSYTLPSFSEVQSSEVGFTSATLSATMHPGNVPAIVEKGFCYSTVRQLPTVNDSRQVVDTEVFRTTLTGLKANTRYYYRAYVIYKDGGNENKTIYSDYYDQSFMTKDYQPITLWMNETEVTKESISLKAGINDLGSGDFVEKGFCWSTSVKEPTLESVPAGNIFTQTSLDAPFEHTITGLASNTTFYIRAYVKTKVDKDQLIGYSAVRTVTTNSLMAAVVNLNYGDETIRTISVSATISNMGDGTLVKRGFCWSKTLTEPKPGDGEHEGKYEVPEGAEFAYTIPDLTPNTTYYITAYVETQVGEEKLMGYDYQQRSTQSLTKPSVSRPEVSNIKSASFTVSCRLYGEGNTPVTETGFCWTTDKSQKPSGLEKHPVKLDSSDNTWKMDVSELTEGALYYVYSYATNEAGTQYSDAQEVQLKKIPQEGDNDSPGEIQ